MAEQKNTDLNEQCSSQQEVGFSKVTTLSGIYKFVENHALIIIGPFVLSSMMIILLVNISLDLSTSVSTFTGSYFGFFIGRKSLKVNQKLFDNR